MKIENLIEEHLTKEDSASDREYFYVGDLDKCKKALYYSFMGEKGKSYDGNTMLRFKIGDALHQLIVGTLLGMEEGVNVVASEVNARSKDEMIHGRADIVLNFSDNTEELVVVDVKTISGYGFKYLKGEPKDSHKTQVKAYMKYLDIDKGLVLYVNKNNAKLKSFEVERDDKVVTKKEEDLKTLLEKNIKKEKMPDISYDKDNWKCKYCKYKKQCLNDS